MSEDEKPNWPPKTDSDWAKIRDALWKVDMMWILMRPINSVRQDWWVIIIIMAAVSYFNRPGIIQALAAVLGGTP